MLNIQKIQKILQNTRKYKNTNIQNAKHTRIQEYKNIKILNIHYP